MSGIVDWNLNAIPPRFPWSCLGPSLVSSHKAGDRILVSQPGIEPRPWQGKSRVLITGLPGNSLFCFFLNDLLVTLTPSHVLIY